jgi:hypothetical protein
MASLVLYKRILNQKRGNAKMGRDRKGNGKKEAILSVFPLK